MSPIQDVLSVLLGSLVGISLGLIGGGGSILTVPLLVYVVGESVSAAIGTSLAIVGLNAFAGFLAHWRRSHVRLEIGLVFGTAGTAGAFFGAWLSHFLPAREILFLFALLMVAAALVMLRRASPGTALGGTSVVHRRYTYGDWGKVLMTGAGVGMLTGFFGVGGGFVVVPALVIVLGLPMRQAVGTSLLIIAINSGAGLIAHLQYGGISILIAALFAGGGLLGTLLGTSLADRVQEGRLRRIFAYGMAAVAVYLVLKELPALPPLPFTERV